MEWRIYASLAGFAVLVIIIVAYCIARVSSKEALDEELTEEYFQKLKEKQMP